MVTLSFGVCFGQKSPKKNTDEIQQAIIKKQIAVNSLESQIKDVPFAAVRIQVRSRIAAWLWKNGKDDSGQAEDLAVKAFEEIYERKNEIPQIYFLSLTRETLALLEANSPATAKKLIKKYNISDEENLDSAYSILDAKDGEKKASEILKNSIADKKELNSMAAEIIYELASRKSPELITALSEIIGLEESGRSSFSAASLLWVVDAFRSSLVSNELRIRFYNLVIRKAREATASSETDSTPAYNLLYAISQDISKNAPNLIPEAAALEANLKVRVNSSTNEDNALNEKIENSPDRLSALISEAEATENKGRKKELYTNASLLALKKKKFRIAVELLEKSQIGENLDDEKNIHSLRWHDQFLGDVSEQSLKANDADSSKYASDKIIDKLIRADVLRKTANYFFEKQSPASATDMLDEALKITDKTENNSRKIGTLLRLIPAFQKMNRTQLSDVREKTAKAINSLPTLNVEDKPETENYKKYVGSIMAIDINLLSTMNYLIKENRNEAANLADGINRREVKIIADYTLLTDSVK